MSMSDKITKEQVHNRITEELMGSPELLNKFMDAYGTMSIWMVFREVENNRPNHNELEKKFYSLRRDHEDLMKKVMSMETKIKSQGKRLQELGQQKMV